MKFWQNVSLKNFTNDVLKDHTSILLKYLAVKKLCFLNQSKSSLEAFIRAKYEQKKYIAREWVPPKVTIPREVG